MRYAIIENNQVVNICEADGPLPGLQMVPAGNTARIGDLFDGEVFTAQPVVLPVPASVTRRQARQALVLAGKFDLVQPAIDAIPNALQRKLMQIEWDDSQAFERDRPSLIAIGGAIGLTSAEVDDLFRTAVTL